MCALHPALSTGLRGHSGGDPAVRLCAKPPGYLLRGAHSHQQTLGSTHTCKSVIWWDVRHGLHCSGFNAAPPSLVALVSSLAKADILPTPPDTCARGVRGSPTLKPATSRLCVVRVALKAPFKLGTAATASLCVGSDRSVQGSSNWIEPRADSGAACRRRNPSPSRGRARPGFNGGKGGGGDSTCLGEWGPDRRPAPLPPQRPHGGQSLVGRAGQVMPFRSAIPRRAGHALADKLDNPCHCGPWERVWP